MTLLTNSILKKEKIQNYIDLIRIKRPIGIWLLLLPCLFGSILSYKDPSSLISLFELIKIVFLFTIGATMMRSAGVIINDIWDQKIDVKVARTKTRPLASKKVSTKEALILFFILLLLGFLILLQFNQKVIYLGFFALFLALIYPLAKRITNFPQLLLGCAYNIGVLMASLEIINHISFSMVILYIISIIWTLIYDTLYAYQDLEDDLIAKVGSTAVKFGSQGKMILIYLTIIMLIGFIFIGLVNNFNWKYFLVTLAGIFYLLFIIKKCNFKDSNACLVAFKANLWFGLIILSGIMIG